jgi:hypothetical protein
MVAPVTIVPLFSASMKDLLSALQLSGVDTISEDAWTITRQGISWARTWIYDKLGAARVDAILTTAEVANPSTEEELDRARAVQLEIWLCKWRLLQDFSVLFRTKESEALQAWNDLGLVREAGADGLQQVLDRLMEQILDLLALLDEDDETEPGVKGELFGPPSDRRIPEPGGSVKYKPQNVWLRPPKNNPGRCGP